MISTDGIRGVAAALLGDDDRHVRAHARGADLVEAAADPLVEPGKATPLVVQEILSEFGAVGTTRPAVGDELALAKSSLTRGYVRHFETPAHLAHAAARLATFNLPENTFERYVPGVEAVTAADVTAAAIRYVRPADATIVLVGDGTGWRDQLTEFGRPVEEVDDL